MPSTQEAINRLIDQEIQRYRELPRPSFRLDQIRMAPRRSSPDIFESIGGVTAPAPVPPGKKPSRKDPNAANLVEHWLRTNWPELVGIRGVWFTGSSVWSHLYGDNPRPDADLDIIAVDDTTRNEIVAAIERIRRAPQEGEKNATSFGGLRYYTSKGSLDIWVDSNPITAIRNYHAASHAHARAAYSIEHKTLVVMPNEAA